MVSEIARSCTAYVTSGPVFAVCAEITRISGSFSRNKVRQFNVATENQYQATKILCHVGSVGTVYIIDYKNEDSQMRCS